MERFHEDVALFKEACERMRLARRKIDEEEIGSSWKRPNAQGAQSSGEIFSPLT